MRDVLHPVTSLLQTRVSKILSYKEFGAYAVEMEGAAIAQAAYLNNVPFLVIRAISDKADGSAEMDYPTFEAQAAEHSFKLTLRILKDIQADCGTFA